MKIKKIYIFGSVGIVAVGLGLFWIKILLASFIQTMSNLGLFGYTMLLLFVITSFIYIRYEITKKNAYDAAKEAAEIVAQEQSAQNPQLYEKYREQIQEHLFKKVKEEFEN